MEVFRDNWKLVAAAVATGALTGIAFKSGRSDVKKKIAVPKKWIRVGTVKELVIYPIKSCKGVNIHEATCTQIGLMSMSNL